MSIITSIGPNIVFLHHYYVTEYFLMCWQCIAVLLTNWFFLKCSCLCSTEDWSKTCPCRYIISVPVVGRPCPCRYTLSALVARVRVGTHCLPGSRSPCRCRIRYCSRAVSYTKSSVLRVIWTISINWTRYKGCGCEWMARWKNMNQQTRRWVVDTHSLLGWGRQGQLYLMRHM